jgi:hypothetical protein
MCLACELLGVALTKLNAGQAKLKANNPAKRLPRLSSRPVQADSRRAGFTLQVESKAGSRNPGSTATDQCASPTGVETTALGSHHHALPTRPPYWPRQHVRAQLQRFGCRILGLPVQMSRPIVVIACMFGSSESWGPQQHPHRMALPCRWRSHPQHQ